MKLSELPKVVAQFGREARQAIQYAASQYLAEAPAIRASAPLQGGGNPPRQEYEDIPVNVLSEWTVRSIRDAVFAHDSGQFGKGALLAESMLADDQVQSAVNGRVKGITKSSVTMQPALHENTKLAKKVAKDCETRWPEFFPEQTIEQLFTWTIFEAFSLSELVWESREDVWIPRLKPWHPLYIWYDVASRRYVVITLNAGQIYIDPNDPKWFLYTPFGAYRGWLRGIVRSCSIPWIVRQFALRDWARYSEVHGLPQKKVKYPAQAPAEAKAAFFSQVKRLGAETSFALPQQAGNDAAVWDVDLLEAKDQSWKGFEGLIQQCNRSIVLATQGTRLTDEAGGSYAKAQTLKDEQSDFSEADARKFATAARDQVLKLYCLYNYGDATLAPTPSFKGASAIQLGVDATSSIITVNEGRGTLGLDPLQDADGEPDPKGQQLIIEVKPGNQAPTGTPGEPKPETDKAEPTPKTVEQDSEEDLPEQE